MLFGVHYIIQKGEIITDPLFPTYGINSDEQGRIVRTELNCNSIL